MRAWRPVVGVLVVVLVIAATLLYAHAHGLGAVPHLRELRRVVTDAGPWAPLVFVLLQVVLNVSPFPRTVFTVAAGLLFGAVWGTLLTLTATVVAAVLAFYLVRWTGSRLVTRYARHPRAVWVRRRLDHHGTLAVTSLRLIPMVPFAALNYLSGLSSVRILPYALGTLLGSIPGTVAMAFLGSAVTGHASPGMIAVSAGCGLLGVAGVVIAARRPLPDDEPATSAA